MIYYIDTTNHEWWGRTLVAFEHNGDFHVSPAFKGMGITPETESITLDGIPYSVKIGCNYSAWYYTDEELAFMIRCQGGEWDDVLTDELVERAVKQDCEAVYRNAADILGVEI